MDFELPPDAQRIVNDFLVWIGFGTLTGLLAKAIMPGRDPGGAVATVIMGILGSVIGCGTLLFFWEGKRITPVSPIGLLVATTGAFVLLAFYRILAGRWFRDEERRPIIRRRVRAPKYTEVVEQPVAYEET
jgi:uncharacterized membrane protein YeaQ/YmgE (transglycosylase-associated protein family)